jgi:hypothetical protein
MTADNVAHAEKRRRLDRVVAACDLCKRRKVKCDGVREFLRHSAVFCVTVIASVGSYSRLTVSRHNLAHIAKRRSSHPYVPSRRPRNVGKFSLLVILPMMPSHVGPVVHTVELRVKAMRTERQGHLHPLLTSKLHLPR